MAEPTGLDAKVALLLSATVSAGHVIAACTHAAGQYAHTHALADGALCMSPEGARTEARVLRVGESAVNGAAAERHARGDVVARLAGAEHERGRAARHTRRPRGRWIGRDGRARQLCVTQSQCQSKPSERASAPHTYGCTG
jgi:hypothetical protein